MFSQMVKLKFSCFFGNFIVFLKTCFNCPGSCATISSKKNLSHYCNHYTSPLETIAKTKLAQLGNLDLAFNTVNPPPQ